LPSGGALGAITTPIASGVTALTVDAFGNIYYGTGTIAGTATSIFRAERKNDGTYTGTGATSAIATGTISSLTADPAGNLYFIDGTGTGNLKMRAHNNGTTVYKVTGAAAMEAKQAAVGADGHLYFTDAADAIQKI
jgi:streptogramin lyase